MRIGEKELAKKRGSVRSVALETTWSGVLAGGLGMSITMTPTARPVKIVATGGG